MSLEVGQQAPDFEAKIETGASIKLSDYRGKKVILYFYPKDNTPGCTTEAQDFTELFSEFTTVGAKIIGVSPDSATSHCKFIDKHNLSITLLTDPEHQLIEAYGAWRLKKFMGKEYDGIHRTTFIIDEQGIIDEVISEVKTKSHTSQILK
jgi:peroxiredoxin Q/BCP